MIKIVTHRPDYGSFGIFDKKNGTYPDVMKVSKENVEKGFSVFSGGIRIRVLSEYSLIQVEIQYEESIGKLRAEKFDEWDHIVEVPFDISSNRLYFKSNTDPEPFEIIETKSGCHRVRIYWGGQYSGQLDGSSKDFYFFQIWPSDDPTTKYLKGSEDWPLPTQPCDEIFTKTK